MTIGAKLFTAVAVVCFLAWGIVAVFGVQPLFRDGEIEVIYGMHEDFLADGTAFHKYRNPDLIVLHLPQAPPERQWWTVDFSTYTVASIAPPRSVGGAFYVIRGGLRGRAVSKDSPPGDWLWQVSGDRASFTSRAFTCRIQRIRIE